MIVDLATLSLFSAAAGLLLLSPGPNMAFVVAHGVSHGWRGGVAAALGIATADLVLTALTAAGVTAVVSGWPRLRRFSTPPWARWAALRTALVPNHPRAARWRGRGMALVLSRLAARLALMSRP